MSNIEIRKEVASLAHALEHFDEDANINALQQAWLAGFETAYPKWNKVEDLLPEDDRKVLVWVNNTENPEWGGYKLGAYIGNWYCDNGRKSHEIVTKWMEIPQ